MRCICTWLSLSLAILGVYDDPSTARALCVAGRSAREAAAGLSAVPEIIQREQRNQYESVVSAVRAELKRAREAWSSEEAAALARLDARLGVSGGVPRASLPSACIGPSHRSGQVSSPSPWFHFRS